MINVFCFFFAAKLMGFWYEVATYPLGFQHGSRCVTITYILKDKNQFYQYNQQSDFV